MNGTPRLNVKRVERLLSIYHEKYAGLSERAAAKELGVAPSTLRGWLRLTPKEEATPDFIVEEEPEEDLPIEEIIAFRKREFAQKKKHYDATRLRKVQIKIPGPIGIVHIGDPHVDDDGTDIATLERHSDLTNQVEGLYAANCGDTTNNWIGRLARLYAQQNCGRTRAVKIAEWLIKRTRWLYMIGGNHDAWSGDDDPIKWIAKQSGTLYQSSEARLELNFPEGEPFTINARHDFNGSSIYNPAHGAMKAIHFGVRDDLSTCGHKHISGYGMVKDPVSGKACHALQIGSYKLIDRYAMEKNLRDQSFGPAALTVVDPLLPRAHPDRCKVFWDPEEGAEYLKFKRSK